MEKEEIMKYMKRETATAAGFGWPPSIGLHIQESEYRKTEKGKNIEGNTTPVFVGYIPEEESNLVVVPVEHNGKKKFKIGKIKGEQPHRLPSDAHAIFVQSVYAIAVTADALDPRQLDSAIRKHLLKKRTFTPSDDIRYDSNSHGRY